MEQCQTRHLTLGQPQGAGAHDLGAEGMVALQVTVEGTGVCQRVPCYILDSSKPLWKRELKDCGLVIGTNTLAELGISMVDAKGCVGMAIEETVYQYQENVEGSKKASESANQGGETPVADDPVDSTSVIGVILKHDLHLGSQQTRVAKVQISHTYCDKHSAALVVITPNELILANQQCDFVEGYWMGESTFHILVTNWETESTTLTKDSMIG